MSMLATHRVGGYRIKLLGKAPPRADESAPSESGDLLEIPPLPEDCCDRGHSLEELDALADRACRASARSSASPGDKSWREVAK